MNFLKENTFLVVTAAIVLVGSTVLLLVRHSGSDRADTGEKPYITKGSQINSLVSSGVNQAIVEAAGQRVEDMRNKAKKVADESLLRNRRDYKVMSFKISGKTVPAFPVDPEFKDRETLRLLFPDKYRLRLKDLYETLRPTVPPTDEEIKDEVARIAASMIPVEKEEKTGPTGPPLAGERFHPPGMGMDMGMGRPTAGRMTGTGVGQSAVEQQALINLVVGQSEKGWIYADKEQVRPGDRRSATGGTFGGGALHVALPLADYNDDRLWLAQVGLWVQRDIVDVINLTNHQVRRTASGDQRGVAASAVKRLMGIDIRGYVLRGAGVSGDKAVTLRYLDLGESKVSKPVPQLTGRACNKLYDVIHYDFTVVMPMRHLLRLQKNLMMQNYHTILAVSVTVPVQSDVHYYYGTDSVMKVTIVGEMLMLTDWTRGRWDKDAKEWDKNFPPLTPERFLEEMKKIDAGAMRDEDNERLSERD